MKVFLVLCLVCLSLYSCSVSSELTLDSQGRGEMTNRIELAGFFQEFFFDIFDREGFIEEVDLSLQTNPGLQSSTLVSTENGFANGITFSRVDYITGQPGELITWQEMDDLKSFNLTINRENWSQMEEMIPLLNDPSISYLGPQGSLGLNRVEFKEMLLYPFAGYASSDEEAVAVLDRSQISLVVSVDGQILSVDNGVKINDNQARFSIDLFDLLMLDNELIYGLSYR